MDISSILPGDFEEDRMFYMQVDPNSILHYLPTLFYQKYSNDLGDWMYLMDLNETRLQLRLRKTPVSGFIMDGFQNMVRFYGLPMGGWLKLVYVGEDIFVVLKVKDYNMVKQPIPPNPMRDTICVNTNSLQYPDQVNAGNVKDDHVPYLLTYSMGGNPLNISHDCVTYLHTHQSISLQLDNMEVNNLKMLSSALSFNGRPVLNGVSLPVFEQLAQGAGFGPNSIFNSHVISARHTATISGTNGQVEGISLPNPGVSFTGFRNNSLMHLASLTRFNSKPEMNNPMDHVINSTEFGQDRSSNEINCTKRLTSNQIYNSRVVC